MPEDIESIVKEIDDAETDFSNIFNRMDNDYDQWALAADNKTSTNYDTLTKTFQGLRETDIKFISPSPRSFIEHVHSRTASADMQVIIRMLEEKGKDRRSDIARLERLFSFAFSKADDRLTSCLMLPPLRDFLIWTGLVRGRMAARIMVWKEGKRVVFDFLPLDPRHVTYRMGANGFLWIVNKSYRSAEAIKSEYPEYKGEVSGLNNEIIDHWSGGDGEVVNRVIYKKDLLHRESYELDAIPLIYLAVPSVPPIVDASGVKSHYGDCAFAAARDVFKFENELLSMWASHAKLLFKQPTLNYYDDEGKILETTAFVNELVINLPMGHNQLEPSPVKEVSQTLVNLIAYVGGLRQRATLPDIEFGELRDFPLSGTAINELQQARDKVLGPIIRTLNIMYTNICYQVEKQLINNGISVKIESELNRKYYQAEVKPVDLKEPHLIRVEFTARTPWTQLDTYQIAQMAQQLGLPDEFIWEYILKLPDPKGLKDQGAIEIAEHSPTMMRLTAIKALIDKGRKDEASALIEELYNDWRQQNVEQLEAPGEEEEAPVEEAPVGV